MKRENNNYSFEQRWSPELAKLGHTEIPNLLLVHQHELGITNGEMVALINLISYQWDKRHPYPAVSTIAKRMGTSVGTIRTYFRSLEEKSLIKRNYRGGQTNEYNISLLKQRLYKISKNYDKKQTPPYRKSNTLPYRYFNTKEDAAKKTHLKRPIERSNTTEPLKDIIKGIYRKSDK